MKKYRIKEVIRGVKTRYQIQKRSVLFLLIVIWKPVQNQIVSPIEPFEYKIRSDAEKKIEQLSLS